MFVCWVATRDKGSDTQMQQSQRDERSSTGDVQTHECSGDHPSTQSSTRLLTMLRDKAPEARSARRRGESSFLVVVRSSALSMSE